MKQQIKQKLTLTLISLLTLGTQLSMASTFDQRVVCQLYKTTLPTEYRHDSQIAITMKKVGKRQLVTAIGRNLGLCANELPPTTETYSTAVDDFKATRWDYTTSQNCHIGKLAIEWTGTASQIDVREPVVISSEAYRGLIDFGKAIYKCQNVR